MSVLIKGIEMPNSCWVCQFGHDCGETVYCTLTDKSQFADMKNDCPLVEVPTPHGRLIDADVLKKKVYEMDWGTKYYPDKFMDEIVHAPAIIEAEE